MHRARVGGLAGALIFVGAASACAGPSHIARRTYQEGDTRGEPRVEALPSLDVDPGELTAEMRMAKLLSAEALNLEQPPPPSDLSTAAITAWSQRELEQWLRQKHQRAEEARRQLDLAAVQNQRQRIMAGALVGLVYEDVARALIALPTPKELIAEPEIAQMYGEVLRGQAAPYLREAEMAYAACAGNAAQLEPLAHWSSFCEARKERLPSRAQAPSGETQVEVVRN